MNIIKPVGEELSVTTADTVENARLVRIYAAAISKVTITNSDANTTIGSFTVPAGSVTIIEKNREDTVEGTTALLCTPISYKS
jgi:hypothetical protein